jgi:hypothetical protein
MQRAAEIIVREGKNLAQVSLELELNMTSREALDIERSKAFQAILWDERHRYNTELAGNPQASKLSAQGMMLHAIQKLLEEGKWDKALDGVIKYARVAGWIGPDSNVNVFQGLNTKELEGLEKKLKGINEPETKDSAGGASEAFVN